MNMLNKLRRYYFLGILTCTISLFASNQKSYGQFNQGAYLELGGNAGIYSLNYEKFFKTDGLKIAGRIGIGLWSEGMIIKAEDKKGLMMAIPFGATGLYSISEDHHAEFGLGATYFTYKTYHIEIDASNINQQPVSPELVRNNDFFPNMMLGYRYQKGGAGFMARAFFNAHLTRRFLQDDKNLHSQYSVITFDPWFGLGVGYGF